MASDEEVNWASPDEWKTFVAFLDISGFKKMMSPTDQGEDKAYKALRTFYENGYDLLGDEYNNEDLKSVFISDSAIAFIPMDFDLDNSIFEKINLLLGFIKKMNKRMLDNGYLLTTSIAFGKFKYQDKIEIPNQMSKEPVYGNAYVNSVLDSEGRKPKIQAGECRMVKKNFPREFRRKLENDNHIFNYNCLNMIEKKHGDNGHYYYYWMKEEPREIRNFKQCYNEATNLSEEEGKYEKIKEVLRGEN